MKRCSKCGASKPLDRFAIDRAKTDGRDSWCRDCRNAARRGRYHTNLAHELQRSRDYYAANREAALVRYTPQQKRQHYLAWKARYPDGLWEQWLKKAHDLTGEQWFAMWEEQGGLCYLCEQPLSDDRSKVAVDHDHSHCGKKRSCRYCRRGLAHDHCNLLLGMIGEDAATLRQVLAGFAGTTFIANFERTQSQAEAIMLAAPEQRTLFDDIESPAS